MRNFLPLLFVILSLHGFSQTKTDPIKILYNSSWEVITSGTPSYIGKAWKEGDKWRKQDFYYPGEKIQMDGIYSDKDYQIKDGQFTWYHNNGQVSESGFYISNKKEGTEKRFYEDGKKASIFHYKNDLPVDSSLGWYTNGQLNTMVIADQSGNGMESQFYENGKLRISGSLLAGKKEGKWLCYDSNGVKLMTLQYQADSLTATTCADAAGNPAGGFCIYERPAEFRGGADGWRRFLEQNLEYPKYAQKKNIQGMVRVQFLVSKTGTVSELSILSSPHESLSNEVLRLMGLSPK